MPDREFENSVQRKANELRLDPSPELWERVSAQINEKDRRRGVAWIWLAAAMIAGALSFWFLQPENSGTKAGADAPQAGISGKKSTDTPTIDQENNTNDLTATLSVPSASHKNQLQPGGETKPGSGLEKFDAKDLANNNSKKAGNNAGSKSVISSGDLTAANKRQIASNKFPSAKTSDNTSVEFSNTEMNSLADNNAVTGKITIIEEADLGSDENDLKGRNLFASLNKPDEASIHPSNNKEGDTRLHPDLLANIPETKQQENKNWNLAFQMGGGSGSMREGISNSYAPRMESMPSGNALLAPSVAAPLDPRPSEVKAGPSFQAGIGFSKPISKKLSLVSGLQYAYFSNRIEVGRKIDSSAINNNFRFTDLVGTTAYTGAGNNGNGYYNAYHYLQMPIELSWSLDPAKRLTWNNGLVLGYLISTDALHYNENAGAYFKDNSLVNKWQTSAQTSIQYKLFTRSSWNIAMGPYMNYQLRNIDKTAGNKRLLTVGLNARLLFGKTK